MIDCATKASIGYAMAEHMKTSLIIEALDMAAGRYDITGAIFRSDRGTQYLSQDFAAAAKTLWVASFCWTNRRLLRQRPSGNI